MESKYFWLSIVGMVLCFFGGFYVANTLNANEMKRLQSETSQKPPAMTDAPAKSESNTLSDEEIKARVAEADKNPSDIDFQRKLGNALLSYGLMKKRTDIIGESARLLQRVHDANPKDFDAAVAVGNAYYDMASLNRDDDGFLKAREYYAKALDLKPDAAAVRADFGSTFVFVKSPDLNKGAEEIGKAIAKDPKNPRAMLLMAQLLIRQDKDADAAKLMDELKKIDPNAPTLDEIKSDLAAERSGK